MRKTSIYKEMPDS